MHLLSWPLLNIGVTSLVDFISVWLYVTFSHTYVCAIASSWSSHSWDFLFPCVPFILLDFSLTSSICTWLFMLRSKLFQTFGLCVSPYFKLLDSVCLPIFCIIPKSLLIAWHKFWAGLLNGSSNRCCALAHFTTSIWWSSNLFLYSSWWRCSVMRAKFVERLTALLNLYSLWRRTPISMAPP